MTSANKKLRTESRVLKDSNQFLQKELRGVSTKRAHLLEQIKKKQRREVRHLCEVELRDQELETTTELLRKLWKSYHTVKNRLTSAEIDLTVMEVMPEQTDKLEETLNNLHELTQVRSELFIEFKNGVQEENMQLMQENSKLRDKLDRAEGQARLMEKERNSARNALHRIQVDMGIMVRAMGNEHHAEVTAMARRWTDSRNLPLHSIHSSSELEPVPTTEELDVLDADQVETNPSKIRHSTRTGKVSVADSRATTPDLFVWTDLQELADRGELAGSRATSIAESPAPSHAGGIGRGAPNSPQSALGKRRRSTSHDDVDQHDGPLTKVVRQGSHSVRTSDSKTASNINRTRSAHGPEITHALIDTERQTRDSSQISSLNISVVDLADGEQIPTPFHNLTTTVQESLNGKILDWARGHEQGERYCVRMKVNKQCKILSVGEVTHACSSCEKRRKCCFRLVERGVLTMVPLRDGARRGEKTDARYWRVE